jgi:hypothetical protein
LLLGGHHALEVVSSVLTSAVTLSSAGSSFSSTPDERKTAATSFSQMLLTRLLLVATQPMALEKLIRHQPHYYQSRQITGIWAKRSDIASVYFSSIMNHSKNIEESIFEVVVAAPSFPALLPYWFGSSQIQSSVHCQRPLVFCPEYLILVLTERGLFPHACSMYWTLMCNAPCLSFSLSAALHRLRADIATAYDFLCNNEIVADQTRRYHQSITDRYDYSRKQYHAFPITIWCLEYVLLVPLTIDDDTHIACITLLRQICGLAKTILVQ